jgi:hypothetical protein
LRLFFSDEQCRLFSIMWKLLVFLVALAGTDLALASTQCTTLDRSAWLKESSFRLELKKQGFHITRFAVSEGRCYEVYGFNAAKRRVKLYFNPVDGSLMSVARVVQVDRS